MGEKVIISNRGRNLVIALLVLVYLAIASFNLWTTRIWANRPFPGFLALKNNLIGVLFLPEWEGFKKGIRFGDIIVAVNGQALTSQDDLHQLIAAKTPGTPVTYTVLRKDKTFDLTLPVQVFTRQNYYLFFYGFMFISLIFMVMGLVVFYLKPNLPTSWAYLACSVVPALILSSSPEFVTNHALPTLSLSTLALIGPVLLVLSLYFPVVNPARKFFLIYLLVTAVPIIFFYRYFYPDVHKYLIVDTIMLIYLFFNATLAVGVMIHTFYISTDPLTRQKGKVVFYGFLVSFVAIMILAFCTFILKITSFYLVGVFAAVIPLSIGYAIVKHNLFDVDTFIRRSASYLLVSGIVVVLFFALVGILSVILQEVSGQSSQIAAVLSTMAMMAMFRPLRQRVDRSMDRRFFREQYEYQTTIRKASTVLVSIIELDRLLNQILDTVLDAVKIERGLILLFDQDLAGFHTVVSAGYADPASLEPVSQEHPLIQRLEERRRAVQINDLEGLEEFRERREQMLDLIQYLQVVLIIPIVYERRLIGMLGLGEKKSGAWYSTEDIELLQTLMMQTAVSIENARKVEELKKMVELESSYRQLKQLDKMKDNFLSMVSHDLRTPMTSIKGYAAILIEKMGRMEEERQKRYLGIICQESDRLTRLINNLLDLQRFEVGKMEFDFQEVDLVNLVQESVASFQGAAYTKYIGLLSALPQEEVKVRADRDRLSQVMANLLSNAIKFTHQGGRVTVSLDKVMDDDRLLVRVAVTDTGKGIAQEMQSKVFNRFEQADRVMREHGEGSGLGLALVREIIEAHGGKVGVESAPGKGSTFYFLLEWKA